MIKQETITNVGNWIAFFIIWFLAAIGVLGAICILIPGKLIPGLLLAIASIFGLKWLLWRLSQPPAPRPPEDRDKPC